MLLINIFFVYLKYIDSYVILTTSFGGFVRNKKKFKTNELCIVTCGRYKRNKDILCRQEECEVLIGGHVQDQYTINYYQCDYNPNTEYITIGKYNNRTHNFYDLINRKKLINWEFCKSYKFGDNGYDFINKHLSDTFFVREYRSLKQELGLTEDKYTYEEILKIYKILIGEDSLEDSKLEDIKDHALKLIISTKEKVINSNLNNEKKKELIDKLFNLGINYSCQLKRFDASSPTFELDKIALRRTVIEKVADIEYSINNKPSISETDIKIFEKKFYTGTEIK